VKEVEIAAEKLLIDERLPVFEQAVALAMDPLYVPEELGSEEVTTTFQAVLRTGGIYMVGREVQQAFYSSAPHLDEYPPLPYHRVWVEARHEDGYPVPLWSTLMVERSSVLFALGIAIVEREQGAMWDVLVPMASDPHLGREVVESNSYDGEFDPGIFSPEIAHVVAFRFKAGEGMQQASYYGWANPAGDVEWDANGDPLDPDAEASTSSEFEDWVEGWAVTAAHVIVADRVPHVPVRLDRAQRRRITRRAPHYGASIYFVDLAASGDVEPGASDRQYHVRWLVQGHWRRNPSGTTFVKRKGCVCSWVKPYVKGPAGAPWKGRPIYMKAVA
jgi:hypothetical protein